LKIFDKTRLDLEAASDALISVARLSLHTCLARKRDGVNLTGRKARRE
jgi:hypothetical protein